MWTLYEESFAVEFEPTTLINSKKISNLLKINRKASSWFKIK